MSNRLMFVGICLRRCEVVLPCRWMWPVLLMMRMLASTCPRTTVPMCERLVRLVRRCLMWCLVLATCVCSDRTSSVVLRQSVVKSRFLAYSLLLRLRLIRVITSVSSDIGTVLCVGSSSVVESMPISSSVVTLVLSLLTVKKVALVMRTLRMTLISIRAAGVVWKWTVVSSSVIVLIRQVIDVTRVSRLEMRMTTCLLSGLKYRLMSSIVLSSWQSVKKQSLWCEFLCVCNGSLMRACGLAAAVRLTEFMALEGLLTSV